MKKLLLFSITISLFGACKKNDNSIDDTQPSNTSVTYSLAGKKWLLYQYKESSMVNPLLRSDTLDFTSASEYTWNGNSSTYNLISTSVDTTVLHFRMNDTPFGNIAGLPPQSFITYKEIIATSFKQIITGSGGQTFLLWMKQIN